MQSEFPVAKRFESTAYGKPTPEMLSLYKENGFLIVENFASHAAGDALKARIAEWPAENWLKHAPGSPVKRFA